MNTSHMPEDRFPTGEGWESEGLICWKLSCSSLLWRRGNRGLLQFRTHFFRLQISWYAVAARWVPSPQQYCYHISSGIMGAVSAAPSCSYIDGFLYMFFFLQDISGSRICSRSRGNSSLEIKLLICINSELYSCTCNAKIIVL